MAGEWIKVRTNLWNDPRVSQMCDKTGVFEAAIIGGLYWLWSTADEHTETGIMVGLSVVAIDRKTGIPGFGAALLAIGWISEHPEGVCIERFDEHNGTSAKTRAQTAKRVANHKNGAKVTQESEIANAPTVSSALAREEKNRDKEEKKEPEAKAKSKAEAATGTRLPADWHPSAEDIEYCKTERPDLRPSLVATNFFDYWISKPGKDGRKVNWSATWRSWVRKESAGAAPRAGPLRGQLSLDQQNAINNAEAKRLLGIENPDDEARTINA